MQEQIVFQYASFTQHCRYRLYIEPLSYLTEEIRLSEVLQLSQHHTGFGYTSSDLVALCLVQAVTLHSAGGTVSGHEIKTEPHLTSKLKMIFLLIFIIFFHFHASLTCLSLALLRCSSVKLSKKGNFKKFPAAFQQNELLLPFTFFPKRKRK